MGQTLFRYLCIVAGAVCVALSLEVAYIPHRFLDGGVTGLAVVVGRTAGVSPVYVLLALNAVCLLVGARRLPLTVLEGTALGVGTMGAMLWLAGPYQPLMGPLPSAVAGGAAMGLGLGVVLRAGGTLDGSELLALVCRQIAGSGIVWFLALFNAALFTLAALLFGAVVAAYSVLAQAAALVVLGVVLRGWQ